MENILTESLIVVVRVIVLILTVFGIIYLVKLVKHVYFGYGVPFVPTPDYKVIKLPEIIKLEKGSNFLDIGCGDGKILEIMKESYPNSKIHGIENSTEVFDLAKKRKKSNGLNYDIIKGDLFHEDFSKYDVIYTFMIGYLMNKIWKKIKLECKPGTLFYSSSYEIKGEDEFKKIEIKENNYIYVYKV